MGLDLRIVFLFFLFLTAILYYLRKGPAITTGELGEMILDFALIPSIILTVVVFALIITRTDPRGLILQGTALIARSNVSFLTAIPDRLENNLSTKFVERHDTDGDGFEEWVVFYEFDTQADNSNPLQVAVYDSDRGNPPVVFPYQLTVPNRDYLSENPNAVQFTMENITIDNNGPSTNPDLPELIVQDPFQLSIFRFEQNSEPWETPTNVPPRYKPIGVFSGSGGVELDSAASTKDVTVVDREQYDRSQLVLRSIYQINPETNSYWQNNVEVVINDPQQAQLAEARVETVDFLESPPLDVMNTPYPEKIVLAFYAATCGAAVDETLCRHANVGWTPAQFLDPNGDAQGGRAGYFGLDSLNSTRQLEIKSIGYAPGFEDFAVQEQITGVVPQTSLIDVTFTANGSEVEQAQRYLMSKVDGHWKINKRVAVNAQLSDIATDIQSLQ